MTHVICTVTLAHGDRVTLTMCMIFREQQPQIQVTTSALWTKSMWVHGFINKTEADWLVKIASHEQLTIEL